MPTKNKRHRNSNLEQAMTLLIQNQAAFVSQLSTINARMDEKFARIDERLARIEQLLSEHHQILLDLPEAIREKIGFKPRR